MKYVAILTLLMLFSCSQEVYEVAYDCSVIELSVEEDFDLASELKDGSVSFFDNHTDLSAEQIEFLTTIGIPAYAQELGFGIPVEVTLAQSILESSWGNSILAKGHYNYFGIKAKKKSESYVSMSTHEYVRGKKVKKDAHFRSFGSTEEAMAERTIWFLDNWRYKNIDFTVYDYKEFCDLLQKKGYATDPHYSRKLQRIIKMYSIDKYANWLRFKLPKYE